MIAYFYKIPIGNVKKLVPNVFDKIKCAFWWKLGTLFKTRIKTKKMHHVLKFNQSQCLNQLLNSTQKKE